MNQLRQHKLLFFSLGLNVALLMVLLWSHAPRQRPHAPAGSNMVAGINVPAPPPIDERDKRDRDRGGDKRPRGMRHMRLFSPQPPPDFPPPFLKSVADEILAEAGVPEAEADRFWEVLSAKDPEFSAQFTAMHELRRELMEALLNQPADDSVFAGLTQRFHQAHVTGFESMLARGRGAMLSLSDESRGKLRATLRQKMADVPPPPDGPPGPPEGSRAAKP